MAGEGVRVEGLVDPFHGSVLQPEHLLVESVSDAVVVTDDQHRIVEWNPAAEQMFGIARDEALGQDASTLIHCGAALGAVETALRNEGRWQAVSPYVRPDGSPGVAEALIVPLSRGGVRIGHIGVHRDLTERQRTLEALRDSEEKYRRLVETSNELIFAIDLEGRLTFVNQASREMLGWDPEELIGRHFADFSVPSERERNMSTFQRVLSGEPVFAHESAALHRDGTHVHALVNAVPMYGGGEIVGMTGTVLDRSEGRAARQEADRSRNLLRSITDNTSAGIYCKDLDGRYTFVNAPAARLVRKSQGEIIGMTDFDLMPHEYATRARAQDEKVIRSGSGLQLEEELFAGTSLRTFITNKFPLLDENGHVFAVGGVFTEITARKAIEEELRDSRRLLEEAQRLASLGSWSWDLRTQEVSFSLELYRIFRLEPGSVVTYEIWASRLHPDDRERAEGELRRSVVEASAFDHRYRIVWPDGRVRHIHSRGEAVSGPDGSCVKLIGACQDVSEAKKAEAELLTRSLLLTQAQELAGVGSYQLDLERSEVWWSNELCRIHGIEPGDFSGRLEDAMSFIHPADREFIDEAVRLAIEDVATPELECRIVRPNGEVRTILSRAAQVLDSSGKPVKVLGVVQDITERSRRHADLERRVREHAALAELGQSALAGTPPDALIEHAAGSLCEVLSVDYAGMLEPVHGDWRLRAGVGMRSPMRELPVFPGGPGTQAGETLATGDPVTVVDWSSETRFVRSELMDSIEARSTATVIVGDRERPFGILGVVSRLEHPFDSGDVAFLQAVANVLADAIARSHAEQQLERNATERRRLVAQALQAEDTTRRRISEALHDEAVQNLLSARHDLEDARSGDPASLDRIEVVIERTLTQLRQSVAELHPIALQHGGLVAALQAVAKHQESRGSFSCSVHVSQQALGVHDQLLLSLSRELLANAATHSKASQVTVVVEREDDAVVLAVTDNGVGIPEGQRAKALADGHIGLASSAERVRAIGGSFEVQSELGNGTTVRAKIPLEAAQ